MKMPLHLTSDKNANPPRKKMKRINTPSRKFKTIKRSTFSAENLGVLVVA